MLTLFKFSQLVTGQLVMTNVRVQTSQSLVKQNTLKISYNSGVGFSSFKTLITWYDRWIRKKYRRMQEDLPISYLLSSPCTHLMQDTKSKQLDIRAAFWVWPERTFFPLGHHTIVRRKNGLQGHFSWMQLMESARIYDKCQTMNKSFYILPASKVLSYFTLQRQSSMEPAHHLLVYSTRVGDIFFILFQSLVL